MVDFSDIDAFLPCQTPAAWLDWALTQPEILLVDHAHCEKKAAATALSLIHRYPNNTALLHKLSRLAREELRHFEQVLALLEQRGMAFKPLSASRYAAGLREHVRSDEPNKLVDTLIIGAYIEARSCERFRALAPLLDEPLAKFYRALLRSEARHFRDYLHLAEQYSSEAIDDRVAFFASIEADLIKTPDEIFRFHSGPPNN